MTQQKKATLPGQNGTAKEATLPGQNDTAKQGRKVLSYCVAKLSDALAPTGHTNHDLSLKRREMHRPYLPRESAGISSHHVPMTTEWLYPHGAEFHRSRKEARETLKPSQDMKT